MRVVQLNPGLSPLPDWSFNSSTGHQLNYKQGEYGKYLVTLEGDIHTWQVQGGVDGRPWHKHYMDHNGLTKSNVRSLGLIGPDGEVSDYYRS